MGRELHDTVATPVGELLLRGDGRSLIALHFQDGPRPGRAAGPRRPGTAPFPALRAQLSEYFAGDRREFELSLDPAGSPFAHRVWSELGRVGFGRTATYGELAARLGTPAAARAVGAANARNPVPIVIPCHRLIGAAGALTGYGGGLARKRFLLALEAGVSGARTYTLVGADGAPYESALPGTLGGHRCNGVYGRLDCPGARYWIARGHYVGRRVFFRDEESAIAAGYRPCAPCMPARYRAWKADARPSGSRGSARGPTSR